MKIVIKPWQISDHDALFDLIKSEGDDWVEYHGPDHRHQYLAALIESATFLLFEDDCLCGYIRAREDAGFGVYVYDLLVAKRYRGHGYGRALLEHVKSAFPNQVVYVMSDVDAYYRKLGYKRIGSIFEVTDDK